MGIKFTSIADKNNRHILIYLTVIVCTILISCNNEASVSIKQVDALIQQSQLAKLFTEGQHAATLTTTKELSVTQKKLFEKIIHRLSTDEKLQNAFEDILENPESIQLDKQLGLNERELKILISIFANKETSDDKGTVFIAKEGDHVIFKGSGQLAVLDSLIIDSEDSIVIVKQHRLDYYHTDSSHHLNKFIPSGEYLESIFAFSGPNGSLLDLFPTITNKYTFVVARLSKSGKTILYLKTQDPSSINIPFDPFYFIILS
jgi:hypothetical protein